MKLFILNLLIILIFFSCTKEKKEAESNVETALTQKEIIIKKVYPDKKVTNKINKIRKTKTISTKKTIKKKIPIKRSKPLITKSNISQKQLDSNKSKPLNNLSLKHENSKDKNSLNADEALLAFKENNKNEEESIKIVIPDKKNKILKEEKVEITKKPVIKPKDMDTYKKNTVEPIPGNNGKIIIENSSYIALSWKEGTDDTTPLNKLKYRLYYSNSHELTTIEIIEKYATPITEWTKEMDFHLLQDLSIDKHYYFNVVVMDENLNKGLYSGSNLKPLFVKIEKNNNKPFLFGFESISFYFYEIIFSYDYYISRYEVTFNEYDYFCDETNRELPEDVKWGRGERPVIFVSWNDAIEYCNWLSKKANLSPAYNDQGMLIDTDGNLTETINNVVGYRLPTEAEWEFAASNRGTRDGGQFSGNNSPDLVSWNINNSIKRTHHVGTKQPNELNIFDMSGNVFEWCHDWFKKLAKSDEKLKNPTGPGKGVYKILRGGSWYLEPEYCKISSRDYDLPNEKNFNIGFRICKTANSN